jgi:hypothetical protein
MSPEAVFDRACSPTIKSLIDCQSNLSLSLSLSLSRTSHSPFSLSLALTPSLKHTVTRFFLVLYLYKEAALSG